MSLGSFLRTEREKKGVTLDQLASATKINIRLLYALEEDRFLDLPATPFVRGFIGSYCKFIGINGEEVLKEYHQFIEDKAHDRPTKDSGHKGYAFEKKEGEQSRTTLWIIMGSFVLIGGVVLLILKPALKHRRSSHLEKLKQIQASPSPLSSEEAAALALTAAANPSPTASSEVNAAATTPSTTAATTIAATTVSVTTTVVTAKPTPSPSPSPKEISEEKKDPLNKGDNLKGQAKERVTLKALDDVTLRYQVDDKKVMTYILKKGISIALRGEKKIQVEVSNPKSIAVRYRSATYKDVSQEKTVFEAGKSAENKEIFPTEKPLVKTPDPKP